MTEATIDARVETPVAARPRVWTVFVTYVAALVGVFVVQVVAVVGIIGWRDVNWRACGITGGWPPPSNVATDPHRFADHTVVGGQLGSHR